MYYDLVKYIFSPIQVTIFLSSQLEDLRREYMDTGFDKEMADQYHKVKITFFDDLSFIYSRKEVTKLFGHFALILEKTLRHNTFGYSSVFMLDHTPEKFEFDTLYLIRESVNGINQTALKYFDDKKKEKIIKILTEDQISDMEEFVPGKIFLLVEALTDDKRRINELLKNKDNNVKYLNKKKFDNFLRSFKFEFKCKSDFKILKKDSGLLKIKNPFSYILSAHSLIGGDISHTDCGNQQDKKGYKFLIGRRINFVPHFSDKYFVDKGIFPEENDPFPEKSYPDLAKKLKDVMKNNKYSDTQVCQLARKMLAGGFSEEMLSVKYLPLILAALFIAEPSRNPSCMIPSLMLLDLIESESFTKKYTWENCLCSPELLTQSDADYTDEDRANFNKKGGYFPMTHGGSYKNEFHKGKYHNIVEYQEDEERSETLSDVKAFIIFCDWLKHMKIFKKVKALSKNSTVRHERLDQENFRKVISSSFILPILSIKILNFDLSNNETIRKVYGLKPSDSFYDYDNPDANDSDDTFDAFNSDDSEIFYDSTDYSSSDDFDDSDQFQFPECSSNYEDYEDHEVYMDFKNRIDNEKYNVMCKVEKKLSGKYIAKIRSEYEKFNLSNRQIYEILSQRGFFSKNSCLEKKKFYQKASTLKRKEYRFYIYKKIPDININVENFRCKESKKNEKNCTISLDF